jgi:hypothetical protein
MSLCHYDGYLDPTSVENWIWVTGLELSGLMPVVQGCCLMRCWHPVVQLPVHGATTHGNSATMSLYGYGLV